MTEYVYVIKGLNKYNSHNKHILKDVYLSFLPGAKIGVIGHNGSGKSTLMRIMAGIDKDYDGEAWGADKIKIGYLDQEPKLDPHKNVFENRALEYYATKKLKYFRVKLLQSFIRTLSFIIKCSL